MKRLHLVAAGALVVLLLAAWILILRVPSNGIAVVENGASSTPRLLPPGFHLKLPGSHVTLYKDLSGKASGEVMVTPVTGGEVPVRYEVSGSLNPERMADVHTALAGRPISDLLSAHAASLLRTYASRVDAVDLLTPDFRTRAAQEVSAAMKRSGLGEATVTLGPPDDETLMAAAQYLGSRGEASKIRMTVSEGLLSSEGARSWKLHTAMGYVNESEKLFSEAERNYLDALAIEPAAVAPMAQLVTMYSAVQDWATLRRILDAALTARPDSPQHLNWTAMVLTRQQDLEGAERMLKRGIELNPDSPVMMANLGTLYMKQGRASEALELFQKAVDAAPDSQQALFNLGTALASQDRFAEALPHLEKAAEAGPMSAPLARTLALVLGRTGDKARAAGYLKQAETLEASQPRPPARGGQGGGTSRGA